MATRHLLTCECGKTVTVGPSQAGDTVACECGKWLEVPQLRKLRELPQEQTAAPAVQSEWGFRQGVLATGLIVSLLLGSLGAYWWTTEPSMPTGSILDGHIDRIAQGQESLTPVQAYQQWVMHYKKLEMRELSEPAKDYARKVIAQYRLYRWASFGAMAVAIVITGIVYASSGPAKRS